MCIMMFDVYVKVLYVFITLFLYFFFFKQKTAYEMRISDWSSDVCSSDLYSSKSCCDWAVGTKGLNSPVIFSLESVPVMKDLLQMQRMRPTMDSRDRKSVV